MLCKNQFYNHKQQNTTKLYLCNQATILVSYHRIIRMELALLMRKTKLIVNYL